MPGKRFIPILFLVACSAAQAQMAINLNQHMLIRISNKVLYGDQEAEKYEGTPFLNDKFVPGVVYSDSTKFADVPMRYNVYDDDIEFTQNKQVYILDAQPRIEKVELEGHTFVVGSYEHGGKIRLGFFIQLESSKVRLLLKKSVTYREQRPPGPLDPGPTPPKYSSGPENFYFQAGKGPLMKVENLKKMIAGFPDRQAELTEFARKEKTSVKKEEDLVKLVRYYNSL